MLTVSVFSASASTRKGGWDAFMRSARKLAKNGGIGAGCGNRFAASKVDLLEFKSEMIVEPASVRENQGEEDNRAASQERVLCA